MPHFKIALPPLIAVTLVGVLVNVGSGPGAAKPEMKTVIISSKLFYKSLFFIVMIHVTFSIACADPAGGRL